MRFLYYLSTAKKVSTIAVIFGLSNLATDVSFKKRHCPKTVLPVVIEIN